MCLFGVNNELKWIIVILQYRNLTYLHCISSRLEGINELAQIVTGLPKLKSLFFETHPTIKNDDFIQFLRLCQCANG